ncbi:hypothetical protein WME99_06935 [Sorangium sp. So ce136]|uniref:hypothetical protein n=1 Tax=Sorangium sp. So ce136 TaxID=3133284 RepID=UPI003F014728
MSIEGSSTAHNVLLVPMQLDALCLSTAENLREALADYTRMPFTYQGEDGKYHYSNTRANISEYILSQPFSPSFHQLGPGIHLHWALPDALTRSAQSDPERGHRFPVVPNRWLISRTRNGAIDQQWVVESDFLYPDLTGLKAPAERPAAAVIPFPRTNLRTGPYQPYRHVGRTVPLAEWQPSTSGEYLRRHELALTAMGPLEWQTSLDHVKASFAAYYPGCFSVFGFHDPDAALGADPTGVRYDVIGWYDRPDDDILKPFHDERQGDADRVQVRQDFERRFRWQLALGDNALPRRTVCYARITFGGQQRANMAATAGAVTLAIGGTGTEALSAYLAHQLATDPAERPLIEQQLDALEFTDQLDQRQLDVEEKFQEARHERGFTSRTGGLLWSIQRAPQSGEGAGEELTLPDDVAHLLSVLNQTQAAYDRANELTAAMSARLFNDWHKFIEAKHPQDANPPAGDDNPPVADFDDALWAHHDNGVAPLRKHLYATGKLGWTQNRRTRAVTWTQIEQRFSVVDVYAKDYFDYYLAELDSDALTKNWWGWELKQYGLTLAAGASAELVQEGGEGREGREWRIVNGAQTYRVKIEKAVMVLYLPPTEDQLAARLLRALDALQQRLAELTPACVLEAVPGPRYWQPSDPVVLMAGDAIVPTVRHGRDGRLRKDGLLACQLLLDVADESLNALPQHADLLGRIRQLIDAESPPAGEQRVGFNDGSRKPWNPFLLEWDVQFFSHPVPEVDEVERYRPDHITRRYTLAREAVDLAHNDPDDLADFVDNAEPYRGFSILSPHAGGTMKQRIAAYVVKQRLLLPEPHNLDLYGLTPAQAEQYLDTDGNAQAILDGYQSNPARADYDDTLGVALAAYVRLQGLPTLSQALSGFNEALLMQKRTLQLDIEDPIGNDDDRFFATQVAGSVRGALLLASTPRRDFNPIRAGELRVTSLRLVDSFGQINDLGTNPAHGATIVSAELMPLRVRGTDDHRVVLPPRLAQPARIQFRWLSGAPLEGEEQPEMNAHPATSPICGWIVPNNLDLGYSVYDRDGAPLGIINAVGYWDPVPGAASAVAVESIPNPHLRKVVEHLTAAGRSGSEFTKSFTAVLNSAVDQSDPEALAHSPALSLLIGRPLCVVRASVNLELQGLPARDKHWRVFNETTKEWVISNEEHVTPISESPEKWTAAFDKVELPIRIGEFRQLNDGLIGYWKEKADGSFEDNTFYAPQSGNTGFTGTDPASRKIVTSASAPVNIHQSVTAPAQILTMLMDPRGVVHATSSVVPAKSITIPPDQYEKALAAIEVTFTSAPLLTGRAGYGKAGGRREVNVPLREQPGFSWSWVSRQRGVWEETRAFAEVETRARLSGLQQICEGWLKLSRETSNGSTDDHGQ